MLTRNVFCKAITFQIDISILLESSRGENKKIVASSNHYYIVGMTMGLYSSNGERNSYCMKIPAKVLDCIVQCCSYCVLLSGTKATEDIGE